MESQNKYISKCQCKTDYYSLMKNVRMLVVCEVNRCNTTVLPIEDFYFHVYMAANVIYYQRSEKVFSAQCRILCFLHNVVATKGYLWLHLK